MKKEYIKHILSLLLFGSNGVVASSIGLSSYEIVFFRTLLGSLFLVCAFFITNQKMTFTKHKKDLVFIILSGIAMGTSWCFLYEAYAQIGVSLGALAYYCGPVIVMILSPIFFKEKLTFEKILGFVVVFAGILLINGKVSGESMNVWGMFCGIMSALTYSFMVMFNKKSKNVTGIENSTIQLVGAFFTLLVFTGFKTGYDFNIIPSDIPAILLIGLINTGFACYLFFSSISRLPIQSVAILGYLEALSAIFFAALFLGEKLTPPQIVGAVCIIGGAMFSECYKFVKKNKQ